jgi:hypothetical protein
MAAATPAKAVSADALIAELIADGDVTFTIGKTVMKLPSPFTWPSLGPNPLEWLDEVLSKTDAAKFRRAIKTTHGIAPDLAGAMFYRMYPQLQALAAGIDAGE